MSGNIAPRHPQRPARRKWFGARTIRSRLAVIVLVPTSLLVTTAAFGVVDQLRIASDAKAVSRLVGLELSTQDLIHSLQRERSLTSALLGGADQYRVQVDAQRRATDVNRQALDGQIAAHDSASSRAVSAALSGLSTLSFVRDATDGARMDRTQMLDFYTKAIVNLNGFSTEGDLGQGDRGLRRALQSLHSIGEAKEAVALERGQLSGVFAQGWFTQSDYLRFTEVRATKLAALDRFNAAATDERRTDLAGIMKTAQADSALNIERIALSGADGRRLKISAPQWSASMTTVGNDLRELQRDVGDDITARVAAIRSDADRGLFLYSLLAAAAVIVAVLLWLYTFRSIMRPLTMLTGEAHDVAERRLPEAVARIQSADEPGEVLHGLTGSALSAREDEFAEVAVALDHLRDTAVRLAVEQAVMRYNTSESLANLGRRNQNLVRRQLGFISALEREEADPNQLANLFELDHLATRMRRNAESLLILVGEHSPRRWTTAVSVGDVLRSAFAEVEDYRRVTLRRADKAMVMGTAAAEIAHLLAELVENALSFSPPDLAVEVQARMAGSEYHIAIVDQGVGMTPEAMATANARLRGEENFLVSPTRDLGHYVVGRLAQRLGLRVWLHDSPLNGVTARVIIPPAMLDRPAASAAPEQPQQQPQQMPVPVGAGASAPSRTGLASSPPGPSSSNGYLSAPIPEPLPPNGMANGMANGNGGAPNGFGTGGQPRPGGPRHAAANTTRNGLLKRQPKAAGTRRATGRPPAAETQQRPPAVPERTPAEVRTMLDNFRSGFHNAEQPGREPQ